MEETPGSRSLGWDDPLEEDMATRPGVLAWRITWTEEAWEATVHGVAKSQTPLKPLRTHTPKPQATDL